ncbi:MAG: hypothetical protein ABSF98_18640 [Bryobacteraceae bacterium]
MFQAIGFALCGSRFGVILVFQAIGFGLGGVLRGGHLCRVVRFQPVRFGLGGSRFGVVLVFQAIGFGLGGVLRGGHLCRVVRFQAVRFGLGGSRFGVVLAFQAIGFGLHGGHLNGVGLPHAVRFIPGGLHRRVVFALHTVRFRLRRKLRGRCVLCNPRGVGLRRGTSAFGECFTIGPSLALDGQLLVRDLLYGDDAGIFGHLDGLTRHRANRLLSRPALQIALGIRQAVDGLLECVGGVPLSAGPACNLDGISRLVELQRRLRVQRHGLDVGWVHV